MISDALRARRFYPLATRHQAAVQAVRYARAIQFLGSKWLLAKPSAKLDEPRYA